MSAHHAVIAVSRFGLGARNNELQEAAGDPRGWLLSQLRAGAAAHPALDALPATAAAIRDMRDMMAPARRQRATGDDNAARDMQKTLRQELRKDYMAGLTARTMAAVETTTPFFERLVHFWSNHFTVSTLKRQILPIAFAFERDAIRPHILGSFTDMLLAAEQHPAMLAYLDNARSIGPNSRAGKRRGKGLNENLAREILELHTLGVGGGYTQADVIGLARIITGWSVDLDGSGNGFAFHRQLHEPGDKEILGLRVQGGGVDEGIFALKALARHPSTATFIATKLARHFIADDPPPAAIDALAAAFRRSDGDLMTVYKTLIALDSAWDTPFAKLKTPHDYIISILRAGDLSLAPARIALMYRALGQMPLAAPSPQGWSDKSQDWIGAEALLQRIDIARQAGEAMARHGRPIDVLNRTLGQGASDTTRRAVAMAGSAEEGLTLLFASPEFQRR